MKYKGRSYLHSEWLTKSEMEQFGKPMKNKINRFNKTFNQRILEGNYDEDAIENGIFFDSSYLEVDRILSSTEVFPVVHQKKVLSC